MRFALTTIVLLLPPSRFKNKLLGLLGHRVAPTARVGICLGLKIGHLDLAEGASIGHGNVIRSLRLLHLGEGSGIGQLNSIAAVSPYAYDGEYASTLWLDESAWITSRHYLDCLSGLVLRRGAALMGVRTTVFTHTRNRESGELKFEPVELGADSTITTCCTVLAGTRLGAKATLAAGATTRLNSNYEAGGLYGGVPAVQVRARKSA